MAILGAHISISGGLHKSIVRGDALGCEVIEIYTQPNRSWKLPPLSQREIQNFRETLKTATRVRHVVAHNSKMVNLAHPRAPERKRGVKYFIEIMKRCEELEVQYLVTSLGSHLGAGLETGIKNATRSLNEVLKATMGFQTKIVIENSAGEGDAIGFRFEQIGKVISELADPTRISFCFDLQHAFAAGYDVRTQGEYEETIRELASHIPIEKIDVIHLADAHDPLGSHSPQGEHIGDGVLGRDAFRHLLNDPRFQQVPMCLETDPGQGHESFERDLTTLRSLLHS